jgi:hypothetical protein
MCIPKPMAPKGFIQRACRFLLPKKGEVPPELQANIDECASLSQLLDLLFSTDFILDEAIIDAFDRRIDQLERCSTTSFDETLNLHLKTQHNGTRTV